MTDSAPNIHVVVQEPPRAATRARLWLAGIGRAALRQSADEWFSIAGRLPRKGSAPEGIAAQPRDARPGSPEKGRALLAGTFVLAGETLDVGRGGDPWDRPSPSRAFAAALHGFDWLRDLVSLGEAGEREALRLLLGWRRLFGRWNAFSWSGAVMERRVFNLACHLKRLTARASEAEAAALADSLARQARQLMWVPDGPLRAAERACAAALAGAALAGEAGGKLCASALARLDDLLGDAILADGGHASRSPEAALELLLDLVALDDGLARRGRGAPRELSRAIDRLSHAVRFFTLPDGRLAAFQGGGPGERAHIAAALAREEAREPSAGAPHSGYQRLAGTRILAMVDTGAPAEGAWGENACAQMAALEIVCGADRLITGGQWTASSNAPQALRLTGAASTVTVGEQSAGEPLQGLLARLLGPRLAGAPSAVTAKRQDAEAGQWVEVCHDGWAADFGLTHERRLFLDPKTDELRGEDRLVPIAGRKARAARIVPVAARFHLPTSVRASLARDNRSVLLRGPSNEGWWLRNDAAEVAIEGSSIVEGGRPRRTAQVVLRSQMSTETGGRIRWKLTAAEQGT